MGNPMNVESPLLAVFTNNSFLNVSVLKNFLITMDSMKITGIKLNQKRGQRVKIDNVVALRISDAMSTFAARLKIVSNGKMKSR
jgi:hypothetical protein